MFDTKTDNQVYPLSDRVENNVFKVRSFLHARCSFATVGAYSISTKTRLHINPQFNRHCHCEVCITASRFAWIETEQRANELWIVTAASKTYVSNAHLT